MRLIDADDLWSEIMALPHNGDMISSEEVEQEIRDAPTVDAVPVVHGRWVQVICHEEFEDGFVDRVKECCSVCHAPNGRRTSNYCPNCGAKMDLEC